MPSLTSLSAHESAEYRTPMQNLATGFVANLAEIGEFSAVDTSQLPPHYARLLSHHDHMTVALESFHGGPVDVHVVAERSCAEFYARNSLLSRHSDGRVVQFGIMKIDLEGLKPAVRTAIEQHTAPLGRILIEHDLLREVQLQALWRIEAGEALSSCFAIERGSIVFGRTANIRVADEPRVDLLEIVHVAEPVE